MKARYLIPTLAVLGLAACSSNGEPLMSDGFKPVSVAVTSGGLSGTKIEQAATVCNGGEVADNGTSISFDTQGNDDTSGDTITSVACSLVMLEMPTYLVTRIDDTRALDGTQDAKWTASDGTNYGAFWNYHPDNGMNLTVFVDK